MNASECREIFGRTERRGGDMISDADECARMSQKIGEGAKERRGGDRISDANKCATMSQKVRRGERERGRRRRDIISDANECVGMSRDIGENGAKGRRYDIGC